MLRQQILRELQDIFANCTPGSENLVITEESLIKDDLGINSVGIIYLVISIEEEFGVDMSEAAFGDFKTVSDVITFIEERT